MAFTVADCCPGMLQLGDHHLDHVGWRETANYFTNMAKEEPASYDVILCHGGLHHVIADTIRGGLDHTVARKRQSLVMRNFAHLLRPGGAFVAKVFAGGADPVLVAELKRHFAAVKHAKPPASRAGSSEWYVVAQGFKGRITPVAALLPTAAGGMDDISIEETSA